MCCRIAGFISRTAYRTDFPLVRGDACAALARVLFRAGEEDEAERLLDQAVECYKAKGADACIPRMLELARSSL